MFSFFYFESNIYCEEAKVFYWTVKYAIWLALFLASISYHSIYSISKHIKIDDILTFAIDKWLKKINHQRRFKIFIWFSLVMNYLFFFFYFTLFSNQMFGNQKSVKINSIVMSVTPERNSSRNYKWHIYINHNKKGICLLSVKEYGTYDEFNETLKVGYWGLYYK
jgi:hypothetical protein